MAGNDLWECVESDGLREWLTAEDLADWWFLSNLLVEDPERSKNDEHHRND